MPAVFKIIVIHLYWVQALIVVWEMLQYGCWPSLHLGLFNTEHEGSV